MWAHLTTIYLNYHYTHHVEAPNEISIELKILWFFNFPYIFRFKLDAISFKTNKFDDFLISKY
jgi:hypothetical protein